MSGQDDIYLEWGPELPASYGEDTIVAFVRDPDCIVFYWDTSPQNADARLVARVHCLTRSTHYDTELPQLRSPWHLAVESNQAYQVSLMRRETDGRLTPLAVSGTVCPPVRHAWQASQKPVELVQAEGLRLAPLADSAPPVCGARATRPAAPPPAAREHRAGPHPLPGYPYVNHGGDR